MGTRHAARLLCEVAGLPCSLGGAGWSHITTPKVCVDNTRVLCDNTYMPIHWTPSADKHGIPRDEVLYAMSNATIERQWPPARKGRAIVPRLYIGPSRFGALEVLAEVGDGSVVIFHAMRLRASTQTRLNEEGGT